MTINALHEIGDMSGMFIEVLCVCVHSFQIATITEVYIRMYNTNESAC